MLSSVESAFLNHGQPQQKVAVGLGATSRVSGKCLQRHFNTGACWGTFDGPNTTAVDNRDRASCNEEGLTLVSSNLSENSASVRSDGPWIPNTAAAVAAQCNTNPGSCPSYGTYSNCSNCVGNSYGNYSFPNCYTGSTVLTSTGAVPCTNRERMRSIYDTRVQASQCNGGPAKMTFDYASGDHSGAVTYGIEYAGQLDPYRQNPYHLKSQTLGNPAGVNTFGTFDDTKYCNL